MPHAPRGMARRKPHGWMKRPVGPCMHALAGPITCQSVRSSPEPVVGTPGSAAPAHSFVVRRRVAAARTRRRFLCAGTDRGRGRASIVSAAPRSLEQDMPSCSLLSCPATGLSPSRLPACPPAVMPAFSRPCSRGPGPCPFFFFPFGLFERASGDDVRVALRRREQVERHKWDARDGRLSAGRCIWLLGLMSANAAREPIVGFRPTSRVQRCVGACGHD